jgi:hypothetical protein
MKQAISFSKERPVVVHDQRGTGASGKPLSVYSVQNMAWNSYSWITQNPSGVHDRGGAKKIGTIEFSEAKWDTGRSPEASRRDCHVFVH